MHKQYSEEQHEAGTKVDELCQELEATNKNLKRLPADKLLGVKAMKNVLGPRYPLMGEKIMKPAGNNSVVAALIHQH